MSCPVNVEAVSTNLEFFLVLTGLRGSLYYVGGCAPTRRELGKKDGVWERRMEFGEEGWSLGRRE